MKYHFQSVKKRHQGATKNKNDGSLHQKLEKEECQSAGYRAYTMDQVFDLANPNKDWDYTGNAIFDEFWFTTW